ncbi:hypothetical protein SYJ56_00230 [Algoriphagus sp. D3-2-R+10]|uniref:hypothetical protein n=1 Tax=Algoriphagus aurantiacus TaxID=3103948 RepID=UPI002B3683DA|nr:hypothetical protein [Algoriphagus sp. D3-2-R+10]MEB2773710.1 hypothetical protein [Algoriphagus sp. D3-2-R+10]
MKKRLFQLVTLFACFQLLSCADGDVNPTLSLSELKVLIDEDAYNSAPTDNLVINSLDIKGDFLTINFSAGGCDGNSWEIKLIDSGGIMESNPPQRNLILSLNNQELCEAYITKEVVFDISELKVSGGKVWLNVTNSDQRILYTY